jgi:cytochrome c553
MKTGRRLILAIAIAAGSGSAGALAQGPKAPELAVTVCSNCHGEQGHSVAPTFPELAGQTAPYIEKQLKDFRDRSRADPHAQAYMWGMASQLTEANIKALATYYAAQTPPSGTSQDPTEVAAGKKIFAEGIESEEVPACAACHGDKAQGVEAVPRVAGQHREYIAAQLLAFKNGLRANDIMHNNAKKMTDEQVREVSAYLASL